jgi:hypothetical protein
LRKLDDLYPYKHSIVDDLFIKTADDNYVSARWSFYTGLDVDFFWLASHCLEKYMKAALLLNERPAKKYGHDIEKLYAAVRTLAPELLPAKVKVPKQAPKDLWGLEEEDTDKFIKRLYLYGQPDNRYLFIGYNRRGSDLLKVDQLVFAVRRLCQPLESHFLGGRFMGNTKYPQLTVRETMVDNDPSSRNLYSNLEKVLKGERGKLLRRALLNWNFPFAPRRYKHGKMAYGFRSVNPVFVRRFLDPLDAGKPDQDKHADDLWQWANDNLYLPKEFIKVFDQARTDRKKAAKAKKSAKT